MNRAHTVHCFNIILKVSTCVCLNSFYYYYFKISNDLNHLNYFRILLQSLLQVRSHKHSSVVEEGFWITAMAEEN